jgi:hypothetical protein
MAKNDAGDHGKEIPAVFHLLSVQKRTLFTPFYLDSQFIQTKTSVFSTGGADFRINGKVLFPIPGYFPVPDSPKRGTIGGKVQGFKEIRLSLAVFPNQKDIFFPDIPF